MPTNREIISEIQNDLHAHNLDDKVSQRYILSKLRGYAALFIKRENDLFRLFNQQDIWTTIDCLRMEQISNVKQCCTNGDISPVALRCKTVSKSISKITGLYSYKNGPVIREVASLDGSVIYKPTTPAGYKRILSREFVDKTNKYYWFENDYLVIPDSNVEFVTLTGFFEEPYKVRELSCDYDPSKEPCRSPLDEAFKCPSHLLSTVKASVLQDLFTFNKAVVSDTNPNLDRNIKQGKIITE